MGTLEQRDIWFAENLARLIERRRLKQIDLARDAKISNITLNRILNQKQPAGRKAVRALSDVLKVSDEDLYRSPQDRQALDPDLIEAIERGVAQVTGRNRIAEPSKDYASLSSDKQKLISLVPLLDDGVALGILRTVEQFLADKSKNRSRPAR